MKIAILVNENTLQRCTGHGCMNAFNNRADSFAGYGSEARLVSFTHAGGDLELKIARMVEFGVTVVHLSTCLRANSPDYNGLEQRLLQHFQVVGYTHGSAERSAHGKKRLRHGETTD